MKILVINAGSSSIKYQLIDTVSEKLLAKGLCEKIGEAMSHLTHKARGSVYETEKVLKDHSEGMELVLSALISKEHGAVGSVSEINAFGHRVLHGGDEYYAPILITKDVFEGLQKYVQFGPLHMPANIMGIEACLKVASTIPNVAVFDTSFHTTIPSFASTYALPYEFFEEYKVKRYGFHGISHKFVSEETAKFLNRPLESLKTIVCHIGNGASLSAVNGGVCVETSMGLTPLEGVVMGTRSGDIDPAICEFIMNKKGWDIKRMIKCLNNESGLLGVSGISNDVRDVIAVKDTNARAQLAIDVYCHRIRKYIGAYAATMGGVDAIVFSAGCGENRSDIRSQIMKNFEYLGAILDEEANKNFTRGENVRISAANSKVEILVIPTNEELEIARETIKLIK